MVQEGRGRDVLLAGLLFTASLALGFNLEPRTTHINKFPLPSTPGREPYFGYSVALQHIEEDKTNWVIVGAPRANSTYHDKQGIVEPGALFRCSLTSQSCEEMQVDPTGNNRFGTGSHRYKDLKDYGWLGGSLDSQPHFQDHRQATCVCAPSWKDQLWTRSVYVNGACYIATHHNVTDFAKQVPLVDRQKQKRGNVTMYAYGQAGFSVHFPDDPTKLIIGAPGVFDWKGAVILFEDEMESENPPTRKKRNVIISQDEMFMPLDAMTYDRVEQSELFGYAVTSGRFLHRDKIHYAAGAPMSADVLGKVLIFEFPSLGGSKLLTRAVVTGQQMGEYFGAALTRADVNGDGLDDLVVGSPMYSKSNPNIPDIGRVHTFLSKEGEGYGGHRQDLYGREVNLARFGTSLASLGDLNADGYEDIAVGAPWENEGAVYIFLGSSSGLRHPWSQHLSPKDFTPALRGFGMSLSRGIDIDNNGYADLAIGNFLSSHVVVVKSRPVAVLSGRVTPTPDSIDWEGKAVISVKACLHYKGHRIPLSLSVHARLILDSDMETRRAVFYNQTSIKEFDENLVHNKLKCRNHNVTVKEDKINPDRPIYLRLEYELKNNTNLELMEHPITDPAGKSYEMGQVNITKECNGTICMVDMKVQATFINGTNDSVVVGKVNTLRVEVSNSGETVYIPTMTVTADPHLFLSLPVSHDCVFAAHDSRTIMQCSLHTMKHSSEVVEVNVTVNDKVALANISEVELLVNVTGEGKEVKSADNNITMSLHMATQANLQFYGYSEEEQVTYKLTEDKKGILTKTVWFNHTVVLLKKGPSPLDSVTLTLDIPISFRNGPDFVKVYACQELKSASVCRLEGTQLADKSKRVTAQPSATNQSVSAGKEGDVVVKYVNCSSRVFQCAQLLWSIQGSALATHSAKVMVELSVDLGILGKHMSLEDGAVFGSLATATTYSLNPHMKFIGGKTTSGGVATEIHLGIPPSMGVPWWVILLAILGSLLLLGLLTYVLKKKGFFKRETKAKMKAQQANLEPSPKRGSAKANLIQD